MPRKGKARSWFGRLFRAALAAGACLAVACVLSVVAYGVVAPPATPLMWLRGIEEDAWPQARRWAPLARISRPLQRAVIASEDQRFCSHAGFDWVELRRVWREYRSGEGDRGASTLTNQLAKNLFLWPGRSLIRKGFEAGFTVLIEAFWSKDRILEVYLNIVEMGDGVYGAEAAARVHFKRRAAELSPLQAALIAAVLPSPRIRADALDAPYMRARAANIQQRMAQTPLGERRVCP
ncbi:MAG TPA: monofunctional biosynthetic peptidoglycan transglycosylase [Alphaproteobacteria bacterium]|jgi:monofunctional biosynthetic peptidoglycan transglycosylase